MTQREEDHAPRETDWSDMAKEHQQPPELEGETGFSLENAKRVLVYQHLEFRIVKLVSDLCTPEL